MRRMRRLCPPRARRPRRQPKPTSGRGDKEVRAGARRPALDFVTWWTVNVGVRESPGGKDKASRADLRSMLSMTETIAADLRVLNLPDEDEAENYSTEGPAASQSRQAGAAITAHWCAEP
jgi:hypothetical protein